MLADKLSLPTPDNALPGRDTPMVFNNQHYVNGQPLKPPFTDHDNALEVAYFGLGCFWGAERKLWQQPGVVTTAVGYMAGITPNPTYEEVCTGLTGHNETVMVVFDPAKTSYTQLLSVFFESHDPTQGMRQGNDRGTQYRSGLYTTTDAQQATAEQVRERYQAALSAAGKTQQITTEIHPATEFYYAEDYHQQYLAKNPNGYCGIGGTGVTCPI